MPKMWQDLHQGDYFKCPKRQAPEAASIVAIIMRMQFQRSETSLVPQKSMLEEDFTPGAKKVKSGNILNC